jgi:hypothetical protein
VSRAGRQAAGTKQLETLAHVESPGRSLRDRLAEVSH